MKSYDGLLIQKLTTTANIANWPQLESACLLGTSAAGQQNRQEISLYDAIGSHPQQEAADVNQPLYVCSCSLLLGDHLPASTPEVKAIVSLQQPTAQNIPAAPPPPPANFG